MEYNKSLITRVVLEKRVINLSLVINTCELEFFQEYLANCTLSSEEWMKSRIILKNTDVNCCRSASRYLVNSDSYLVLINNTVWTERLGRVWGLLLVRPVTRSASLPSPLTGIPALLLLLTHHPLYTSPVTSHHTPLCTIAPHQALLRWFPHVRNPLYGQILLTIKLQLVLPLLLYAGAKYGVGA